MGELAGVDTRSMSPAFQTLLASTHSTASMTSSFSTAWEREKETEKEGLSRVSSVSPKAAMRPSPLSREMDEGVGAREYIMSVGSTGSERYMYSSNSKILRHKDVVLLNVHNMGSYCRPQSVHICDTEWRPTEYQTFDGGGLQSPTDWSQGMRGFIAKEPSSKSRG
jgi:hypothetical protein